MSTIKLKRGTDEALRRLNPILAAGEPIVVFCANGQIQLKIGDGKTPYSQLALSTYLPDNVSIAFNQLNKIELAGFESAYNLTVPFKVAPAVLEWVSLDFISSNTQLGYNANTGEIELRSVSGKIISTLDAAEFAVAGLIEDVGYDPSNNTLVFIWNTTNGTKTSVVPLEDMLSPYTEGQGIQIKDSVISVKLDPETEPYLSITESGLKLDGINALLDEINVRVSQQLDTFSIRLAELSAAQESIKSNLDTIDSTVVELSEAVATIDTVVTEKLDQGLTELQEEVDTLSDSVQSLKAQDIQGMIDSSLEGYVTEDTVNEAVADAVKDLDINIEKIDGGWITDVPIEQS